MPGDEVPEAMQPEGFNGNALGFDGHEIEQSIPDRFAKIVAVFPAVQSSTSQRLRWDTS